MNAVERAVDCVLWPVALGYIVAVYVLRYRWSPPVARSTRARGVL